MSTYDFEAADFALSKEGIHLLRSRFNYKTIEYAQVKKATIKRGTESQNTLLAFIVGIGLLLFAFFQIYHVITLFTDPDVHVIYIETILLPLIPGLVGAYLVYVSMKKSLILVIETDKTNKKLSIKELIKNNGMDELKKYLNQKLPYSFFVELEK